MYNDSFRKRYGNAPAAISSTENLSPTKAHIHNEVELLYILSGTSEIQISNQCYTAKAGDLLFVNPLEVHAITPRGEGAYCHRCICFDPSLIADKKIGEHLQKGQIFIPRHFPAGKETTNALRELFDKMYESVAENSPVLLLDATACVCGMFSLLVRQNLLEKREMGEKQAIFCSGITDYIAEHYAEPITSREIARALYYTQYYFCRKFKSLFGVSFSEYLNMYRLLKGKEMLSVKDDRIQDVALACGFNDATYFAKSFKKAFGMTPLKWKKSQYRTKI